ncbi:hypothetical protein NA56DRAFT_701854 [Hyaloscypha hepaticicola]|uniref:Uncharacterized protein n=1 Tax=Hyaloscypha hepaticicola TaxID=2082293 RepID=A0A2J6Q958_9HELO|nr:hypothetical protein NA56DRAFT_701854 [Hyaloscypha hepaticicola]
MEMRPLTSSSTSHQTSQPTLSTSSPITKPHSPKLESTKMARQDSGYQEMSPRTSTSSRHSSTRPSKPKRRSTAESSSKSSSRPSNKKTSRSSTSGAQVRTSISGSRPSLSSRHTSPFPRTDIANIHAPYKFFQFPAPVLAALPPSEPEPEPQEPAPLPPPATTQYWTSDTTRRMEYAAIDAAGKGVRGFFIRLVPDCILPPASRRTRFCEDDAASDAGSVRRYRLCLPEEKDGGSVSGVECGGEEQRKLGLWRRVLGRGR